MIEYMEYAEPGTTEYSVLEMHYAGRYPSEIGAKLGIGKDRAREIVSDYWKWDTEKELEAARARKAAREAVYE